MMRPDMSIALIGSGSMLQSCVTIAEQVPGVSASKIFIKKRHGDAGRYMTSFFDKHHVECVTYEHLSTVKESLAGTKADLLISVYNEDRLDSELLSHFRYGFNFHPSPLPRYGGLSPESWAILAGETVHGATWHVMAPELDTGDIVAQQLFALDPAWTAYDVSVECVRTGCALFEPLLSDLAQGKLTYLPQDASKRSYFTRKALPFGGRFPFRAGYEIAERLRRATAYFPIPNPFCIPTVTVGNTVVGLVRFSVHAVADAGVPGTILATEKDGICFAMAGGVLKANLVMLPDGRNVRSTDPAALAVLKVGSRAEVEDETYDAMGLRIGSIDSQSMHVHDSGTRISNERCRERQQ